MSVLNKVPFINLVLSSLSKDYLLTLASLMNGEGDRTEINRTLDTPSGNRTNISVSDKGVHMCSLQCGTVLFHGYLLYNDSYCVLIHFTDFQRLSMFNIDVANKKFETVSEYLDINELRSLVGDLLVEAGEDVTVQTDDIDSGDASKGLAIISDGDGGAEWGYPDTLIVEIDSDSGTFADADYEKVSGNNCEILYEGQYFKLDSESESSIIYKGAPRIDSGNTYLDKITITKSSKEYVVGYDVVALGGSITIDDAIDDDSENPVQNKVIAKALDEKANVDGNYPTMGVGKADVADNISTDLGATVEDAYATLDPISVAVEDGDFAKMLNIKGNSVVVNQWAKELNSTNWVDNNTSTTYNNGVATFTATAQNGQLGTLVQFYKHIYFISANIKLTTGTTNVYLRSQGINRVATANNTNWQSLSVIYTSNYDTENSIAIRDERSSGWDAIQVKNVICVDLTQWFGAGNEPTTTDDVRIKWLLSRGYIAYNTGSLISSQPNKIISTGLNQWDEQYVNGYWNENTGNYGTNEDNYISSKNKIRVMPDTYYWVVKKESVARSGWVIYYDENENYISTFSIYALNNGIRIITPSNCCYINFSIYVGTSNPTYNHDICINISNSSLNGTYKPFERNTYPLNVPVMRSAGSVHDDVSKVNVGVIDLWTLDYGINQQGTNAYEVISSGFNLKAYGINNFVCNKLVYSPFVDDGNFAIRGYGTSREIAIRVPISVANTVAGVKQWLQNNNVVLNYELAAPTDQPEIILPENIKVFNGGTLETQYESPNICPALVTLTYQINIKSFIEGVGSRNDINWIPDNVVSQTELKEVSDTVDEIVEGTQITGKSRLANNFDSKLVINDKVAYNFRTTAGSEEVGDPCKVKSIVGGTIFWNQLIQNGNFSDGTTKWGSAHATLSASNNVLTATKNEGATQISVSSNYYINFVAGHKYLLSRTIKSSVSGTLKGGIVNIWDGSVSITANTWLTDEIIVSPATSNSAGAINFYVIDASITTLEAKNMKLFDLTTMFGATVADYIYSLEQANAGAGIAWFKKYFPKDYYAYSEPTPLHVKISGKKITRFNQWDEEWEVGSFNIATGEKETYPNIIRSKNKIMVIGGLTYCIFQPTNIAGIWFYDENGNYMGSSYLVYPTPQQPTFSVPLNCGFINFATGTYGTTYNHDICINFHWDGERDGEYEPYYSNTYPIDDVELKGIPMVDANGNLYFDGDEYGSDGTVNVNMFEHTFSSTSSWSSSSTTFYSTLSEVVKDKQCLNSAGYKVVNTYSDCANTDKSIYIGGNNNDELYVHDSNFTSTDVAKSGMAGVKVFCLKATPTQSSATPFIELQECDNWGSEELIDAHTGDVAMPAGHNTDYLPDLKAKLETAPSNPDSDGDYVMHREDGENSYTPLGTWLGNNGYEKQTDLSSGITDVAGLTYKIKKLYKTGNVITLTIDATNETGSTIGLGSTLFSLSQGTFNQNGNISLPVRITGNNTVGTIQGSSGNFVITDNLANNSSLFVVVSYAVE